MSKTRKLEEIIGIVAEALASKYRDIEFATNGGTRHILKGKWGPNGERAVAIKVDYEDMDGRSPRAQRHVGKGYNSGNDTSVMARLPEAESHGLLPVLDFADLREHGYEGNLHVEPWFESETLQERIGREGALDSGSWKRVVGEVLRSAQYYASQGFLHRDLKPSNILFGIGENEGKTKITDFANAGLKDEFNESIDATAGSVQVTDHRHYSVFNGGKPSRYDEQSEIYSIGMNMIYSALGRLPVQIDPDKGIAIRNDTGESLLNDDGRIDSDKYMKAIDDALKELPSGLRRFREMMKNAVSDAPKRPKSIDELVADFEAKNRPGIFATLKQHPGKIGAGVFAGILGGIILGSMPSDKSMVDFYARANEEKNAYRVEAEWNGYGPELVNNLVNMNLSIINYTDEDRTWYPEEDEFIRAKPGDKISVSISASAIPRPKKDEFSELTPALVGRAYFEGLPLERKVEERYNPGSDEPVMKEEIVNDFGVWASDTDLTGLHDSMGSTGSAYETLVVPSGLKDGTYILAVELYAPDEERIERARNSTRDEMKNLRFEKPGAMLARKRVPVVVGNPEPAVDLSFVRLGGYMESFGVRDLKESEGLHSGYIEAKGLNWEFSIPEEKFYSDRFNLPKGTSTELRPLQMTAKDDAGNVLYYTALPIQRRLINPDEKDQEGRMYWWDWGIADNSFADRIADYKEDIK